MLNKGPIRDHKYKVVSEGTCENNTKQEILICQTLLPSESRGPIYNSQKEHCLSSDPVIPWNTGYSERNGMQGGNK